MEDTNKNNPIVEMSVTSTSPMGCCIGSVNQLLQQADIKHDLAKALTSWLDLMPVTMPDDPQDVIAQRQMDYFQGVHVGMTFMMYMVVSGQLKIERKVIDPPDVSGLPY